MPTVRLTRVEARGVSKLFGRHRALSRVSLTLEEGRVTGLLGPNGSGKTTLLNLFSTLSRPTSGTMHFNDLAPQKAHHARGQIGLLSHSAMTYPDLTAVENVAFFAKLYNVPDPEREAERLLESVGLQGARNRQAKTFSRGMLQRLGLARALVGRPSLVLLDEPFTGLDHVSTRRVGEMVKELKSDGTIVLMISHDLGTTAELADEVAILVRGKLEATYEASTWDTVDGLRAKYAEIAEPTLLQSAAGAS